MGAFVGRRRTREIWLGAALFGWGYLILAFGWHPYLWACPKLVTSEILETIRPWLPSSVSGIPAFEDKSDPANARILKLLDEPVPMHFPTSMTLEELLKHVKDATSRLDGKGIPIYVDPIGLQEAEKSMTSTVGVRLDRDDIALKNSLHLCLRQLQLAYCVKNGFLQITCADDELPINDDLIPDRRPLPIWADRGGVGRRRRPARRGQERQSINQSSIEIVLGKLAARMTHVLGIHLCVLPVLSFGAAARGNRSTARGRGDASDARRRRERLRRGVTLSTWGTKTHEVLLATYAAWALWLLALPIWWCCWLHRALPTSGFMRRTEGTCSGSCRRSSQ